MQAFDFINDFARWFVQFVPHWELLEPTEKAVKFKPGMFIEELPPGEIYWWWPVTTQVVTIEAKRQPLTFGQRLTTKDDITVQINTVVVFTIDDVKKALVETRDFEETIGEVAQKLTVRPIMSRTFNQIREDMADSNDMRNEITRGAKKLLSSYGVDVLDAYVSDFTETTVFSHDGDGMAITQEEDE